MNTATTPNLFSQLGQTYKGSHPYRSDQNYSRNTIYFTRRKSLATVNAAAIFNSYLLTKQ